MEGLKQEIKDPSSSDILGLYYNPCTVLAVSVPVYFSLPASDSKLPKGKAAVFSFCLLPICSTQSHAWHSAET